MPTSFFSTSRDELFEQELREARRVVSDLVVLFEQIFQQDFYAHLAQLCRVHGYWRSSFALVAPRHGWRNRLAIGYYKIYDARLHMFLYRAQMFRH